MNCITSIQGWLSYRFRARPIHGKSSERCFRPSLDCLLEDRVVLNGAFTDLGALGISAMRYGDVVWGDYDSDGKIDLVVSGQDDSSLFTRVYHNEGTSGFVIAASLTGLTESSAAWGDYDNDGDLDLLMEGRAFGGIDTTRVYRNDGVSGFNDIGAALTNVFNGSVAWGDYDNDGDLDILMTGMDINSIGYAKIYRNDGAGSFFDVGANLTPMRSGSAAWGDYDGDGDLDALITGSLYMSLGGTSKIYRNDGTSGFLDIGAGLTSVSNVDPRSAAWGDYDNDGDLDVLLTGSTGLDSRIAKVYRNDGGTSFVDISAPLTAVDFGAVAWGDYDNDGDLDIALTGQISAGGTTLVYRNEGSDVFTNIGAGLTATRFGPVAWGDYDNDGDLDLVVIGLNSSNALVANVYQNNAAVPNTVPGAPAGLSSTINSSTSITFSWTAPTDGQTTPAAGLSYNLRVGTTSGGDDVFSTMADGSNGYRRIVHTGPIQGTSYTLTGLPANTPLFWSVQAIDTAFAGGPFAAEQSTSAPNQAPVNHLPGTQTLTTANSLLFSQANGNAITVTDPDAGAGNVTVNLSVTAGTLAIAINWGVTFTGYGTSNITLTGALDKVNKTLDTLFFQPHDLNGIPIAPGNVTLTVDTTDNGNTGSGGARTDVDPLTLLVESSSAHVNSAPTITAPAGSQTVTPLVPFSFNSTKGNAIMVGDVDAGYAVEKLTLSVSQGTLNLATTVGLTFVGGSNNSGTLTIRGRIDHLNYNLQTLTYTPFGSFSGGDTLDITINDLGHTGSGGAKSDATSVTLVGTPLPNNQAPAITIPANQTVAPSGSLLFSQGNGNAITLADPDSGTADITVNLKVNSGRLVFAVSYVPYDAVHVQGYGTKNLTITGSQDAVNKTLNTLFYQAGSAATVVTMTITSNDNGNTGQGGPKSATQSLTINVASHTNATPTITTPLPQSVAPNGTLAFKDANNNSILVGDLDSGYSDVKVTLSVDHGNLSLPGFVGTSKSGEGTSTLTLVGRIDHLNYSLQKLLYLPTTGYTGEDVLTITIDDQGASGSGGPKTATKLLKLTVA